MLRFERKIWPRRAVVTLAFLTSTAAVAQGQRAALYSASEEAKKLIVEIKGAGVFGSGIVFNVDENYVYGVTAEHVLRSRGKFAKDLVVRLRSWPRSLPLEILKGDPQRDLAAFRVAYRDSGESQSDLLAAIPFRRQGSSSGLDVDTGLFTVGHAASGSWIDSVEPAYVVRHDVVSTSEADVLQFRTDCPDGHSGGGLFDKRWNLVGMMTSFQAPFCHALTVERILATLADWGLEYRLERAAIKGEAPPPKKNDVVVAVVDFDNRSGVDMPDIGPAGRDITTSFLYDIPGVTVVTRDRLDSVLRELHLKPTVGSVSGVSRLGKLLDAHAIVTGSVNRYDVERRTFKGYNTSAAVDNYHMSITLQIVEVDTGEVKFSRTYDTESKMTYSQGSSAPRDFLRRESELLKVLLEEKAVNDVQRVLRELTAGVSGLVAVSVVTNPPGAEVVVGSTFEGNTPLTLHLSMGLHEIEVRKAGYQVWRREVRVQPDMQPLDIHLSR